MRFIIVEDEPMARMHLKALCSKIDDIEYIGEAENGVEAIRLLEQKSVDFMFLDIEMPDLSGIDLLKSGRDLPPIIFTTSKTEYALEAFEYKECVIDFLSKPLTLNRLMKAVDRVKDIDKKEVFQEIKDSIFIRVDGRLVRLELNDVLYIETLGDYVVFKTLQKKYTVYSTLKNIDSKLNHPNFLKVHRSYIVNLEKIVDIEDTTLVIDKSVIPISRANRPILLEKINTIN